MLPAQAVVVLEREVGGEGGVGSLGEGRFDGFERRVGDRLERAGGDAFFDGGLAVEDDGDAFALQDELGVGPGGVAVGDEVDRAGRAGSSGRGCGRWRCRCLSLRGRRRGWLRTTLARQAFWIVVSRAGRIAGIVRIVLATWASPGADLKVSLRLAPSALLVLPWVWALTAGLKGRFWQPATWKGEETVALAPWAPLRVPSMLHRVAVGGVVLEVGPVDGDVDLFELQRDAGGGHADALDERGQAA